MGFNVGQIVHCDNLQLVIKCWYVMQYHYFKFVYSYNNLQYTGTLIKQAVCTAPQPLTTQSQKKGNILYW